MKFRILFQVVWLEGVAPDHPQLVFADLGVFLFGFGVAGELLYIGISILGFGIRTGLRQVVDELVHPNDGQRSQLCGVRVIDPARNIAVRVNDLRLKLSTDKAFELSKPFHNLLLHVTGDCKRLYAS